MPAAKFLEYHEALLKEIHKCEYQLESTINTIKGLTKDKQHLKSYEEAIKLKEVLIKDVGARLRKNCRVNARNMQKEVKIKVQ